jgi:hypothetical protein
VPCAAISCGAFSRNAHVSDRQLGHLLSSILALFERIGQLEAEAVRGQILVALGRPPGNTPKRAPVLLELEREVPIL